MSEHESERRTDRTAKHADEVHESGNWAVDEPDDVATRVGSELTDIGDVHYSIDVELDPEPPTPGPE